MMPAIQPVLRPDEDESSSSLLDDDEDEEDEEEEAEELPLVAEVVLSRAEDKVGQPEA